MEEVEKKNGDPPSIPRVGAISVDHQRRKQRKGLPGIGSERKVLSKWLAINWYAEGLRVPPNLFFSFSLRFFF